jgi:hypothetical protein
MYQKCIHSLKWLMNKKKNVEKNEKLKAQVLRKNISNKLD